MPFTKLYIRESSRSSQEKHLIRSDAHTGGNRYFLPVCHTKYRNRVNSRSIHIENQEVNKVPEQLTAKRKTWRLEKTQSRRDSRDSRVTRTRVPPGVGGTKPDTTIWAWIQPGRLTRSTASAKSCKLPAPLTCVSLCAVPDPAAVTAQRRKRINRHSLNTISLTQFNSTYSSRINSGAPRYKSNKDMHNLCRQNHKPGLKGMRTSRRREPCSRALSPTKTTAAFFTALGELLTALVWEETGAQGTGDRGQRTLGDRGTIFLYSAWAENGVYMF